MIKMKIFIWLFCFFVVTAIQTAAHETGVVLSGIPLMLLYGLACWSAKKLCARWDQRQAQKADSPTSASPSRVAFAAKPEPTNADPSSPTLATPKLRYCKHCGSSIDLTTRQCTGCGKQYFRPPVLQKKHLFIGAAALACAVVAFLVFNLVSQKNTALSKVDQLTAQITELENTVVEKDRRIEVYKRNEDAYQVKLARKTDEYDKLRKENTMYKEYLRYCEYYCAYIVPNGQIYHRLDCPYAGATENLVILYIDFLESKGCKPCPHCYG